MGLKRSNARMMKRPALSNTGSFSVFDDDEASDDAGAAVAATVMVVVEGMGLEVVERVQGAGRRVDKGERAVSILFYHQLELLLLPHYPFIIN